MCRADRLHMPAITSSPRLLIRPDRALAYAAVLSIFELFLFTFNVGVTHGWAMPTQRTLSTDFADFYAAGAFAASGKALLAYDLVAHRAAEALITNPDWVYQYFPYPPVFLL